MKLRVDLCPSCADVLRRVLAEHGADAMATKVLATLQACALCRKKVPDGPFRVKLKASSPER